MKTHLLLAALALALSACMPADSTSPANQSAGAPSTEAAASSVWPYVSPDGKLAPNLLTKNYMVVFDGSGSMAESACKDSGKSKVEVAKAALDEFARVVPVDANLGLVVFDNQGISVRVRLGASDENRRQFAGAVTQTVANGGTPLHSSMSLGYDELTRVAATQLGYGEYHLVVVTDGEANLGEGPGAIVETIAKTPILIHTIGFCIGADHSLNQAGVTLYQEAGDQESLRRGLEGVLAEAPSFDSTFKP